MTEPIQYDFEFAVLAKSPWLAPLAKGMAAIFYCIAIFGAIALHVVAGACLLMPDSSRARDFLAGYQAGMISISHFAVMAIASSLVSGLFRNKESMRIRARRSGDGIAMESGASERRMPKSHSGEERPEL